VAVERVAHHAEVVRDDLVIRRFAEGLEVVAFRLLISSFGAEADAGAEVLGGGGGGGLAPSGIVGRRPPRTWTGRAGRRGGLLVGIFEPLASGRISSRRDVILV
jgi:hypothetical protein